MRKLARIIISVGKDFASDTWGICFGDNSKSFTIFLKDGFKKTMPYPGTELEIDDIHNLIVFLENTLKEREENEQSNMG